MDRAYSANINDNLLLARIREGDSKSFGILYEKYWKLGYNTAYKRLKDTDQSKDIIHDVFINIWHNKWTEIRSKLSERFHGLLI